MAIFFIFLRNKIKMLSVYMRITNFKGNEVHEYIVDDLDNRYLYRINGRIIADNPFNCNNCYLKLKDNTLALATKYLKDIFQTYKGSNTIPDIPFQKAWVDNTNRYMLDYFPYQNDRGQIKISKHSGNEKEVIEIITLKKDFGVILGGTLPSIRI